MTAVTATQLAGPGEAEMALERTRRRSGAASSRFAVESWPLCSSAPGCSCSRSTT